MRIKRCVQGRRPRQSCWPQAARLTAAPADPDRGFDVIVIGSHERVFYGNQYTLMAPLFAHHGVQLWMPELGGPVDPSIDSIEEFLVLLGILAKREIARARMRSTSSMTAQVRDHGRWQGGGVPYGYRLVDAGPHWNRPTPAGAGAPTGSTPTRPPDRS